MICIKTFDVSFFQVFDVVINMICNIDMYLVHLSSSNIKILTWQRKGK